MLKQYRRHVTLGPSYAGQPGALSAVVEDTNGVIVATISTFTEIGTGEYEGVVTLDTALSARYRYTWIGFPARDDIEPDSKVPSGLPANTLYAYPATLSLGSGYSGQADKVRAQVVDTTGSVLTTIAVFVEVGTGTGEYEANPLINSSWDGLVRYIWSGAPEIITIEPDELVSAVEGGTSSNTTLTPTDHANIVADVLTGLTDQGLTREQVSLLSYLRTLVRDGASGLAAVTGKTLPPVVPGNDYPVSTVYEGLPAGTQLVDATLQVRLKGTPVAGVPDRTCTTAGQTTPGGLLSTLGSITDPGHTNDGDGTVTAIVGFFVSATETAHLASPVVYSYNVTAHDTRNLTHTLEIGTWSALSGGPLG